MISWGNMRDIAKECYENCEIGAVSVIRPDLERGETFEDFQSDVKAAEVMQLNGQISISDIHKESQTGHRYVDSIMFKRLK